MLNNNIEMKRFLTFKYYIKPTETQIENFVFTFECVTIVHNQYIDDIENKIELSSNVKQILNVYVDKNLILSTANSSALMNKLFQLQASKAMHHIDRTLSSFTISNLSGIYSIYIFDNKEYIHLGRFGNVKIVYHRSIPEQYKILKATVKKDVMGNYYVILMVYCEETKIDIPLDINKSIGLDYSSPYFYVDNTGYKANKPKSFEKVERRIIKKSKKMARCAKGSKNYYKLKKQRAKLYIRSNNQRMDYLHKESTRLVKKYDIICVENLDIEEIAKRYNLAKRTYDNSYGRFIYFLSYKASIQNKELIKIDKKYPSSKRCNVCGYINKELTIDDRMWQCPDCGTTHDRDINAAINIRKKGLEKIQFRRVSGIRL